MDLFIYLNHQIFCLLTQGYKLKFLNDLHILPIRPLLISSGLNSTHKYTYKRHSIQFILKILVSFTHIWQRTSSSTVQKAHYLHRRAIDIVGQYHKDRIPNFNNKQVHPTDSNTNAHPVHAASDWLQKRSTPGNHGDEYSQHQSRDRREGSEYSVPYQPHGYYKEGKVETIETKEYRIFQPTE